MVGLQMGPTEKSIIWLYWVIYLYTLSTITPVYRSIDAVSIRGIPEGRDIRSFCHVETRSLRAWRKGQWVHSALPRAL